MNDRLVLALATTALLSAIVYALRHRISRVARQRSALPEVPVPAGASEAMRLAHLMVTEIKLYNLQEVEAVASRGSNPTQELLAEIAHARRMYEERVDPDESQHFATAVLEILAGGRQEVASRLLTPWRRRDGEDQGRLERTK